MSFCFFLFPINAAPTLACEAYEEHCVLITQCDRSFHASDYLGEGVFQLAPKTESELDEKILTAREIARYIEDKIAPPEADPGPSA